MNSRAPVALAIGVGYLLGRTHKMRWALILGTAAASGRLNGLSTQVLERGTEALRSSPELAKITDSARGLLDAGKTAAVSAMTSRAESIGTKLEGGTKRLGAQGTDVASRAKSARTEAEDNEDQYDEDEYDDEDAEARASDDDEFDEEEAEEDEGKRAPSRTARRGSSGSVVRRTGR
jgi:hypothetical protein